jgi:hypothetical protein
MGFGKFQKYKRGIRKMIMGFKDKVLVNRPVGRATVMPVMPAPRPAVMPAPYNPSVSNILRSYRPPPSATFDK